MSERRHRLYDHEIPEVVEGLRLRLERLEETREDPERAEIAFRTLHRLIHTGRGRPKYPNFDWGYIHYFLNNFPLALEQGRSGRPRNPGSPTQPLRPP